MAGRIRSIENQGHVAEVVKPGTAQKAALKTVFVYSISSEKIV
jgi:hypothetical protein